MKGLACIGVLVLFVALPFIGAATAIYDAYWATKIWALLVVPATGWASIPLAGFAGIALSISALRLSRAQVEKDESPWAHIAKGVILSLIASPLAYLVARIAAGWLL